MPSWITITIDDLYAIKTAELVDPLRTKLTKRGQPDPADVAIEDAVTEVRNNIAACASNKLDSNPMTIPPELRSLCVRIAVRQMQGRLNVKDRLALSEDDRLEQRRDDRRLERIAECRLPVAQPDDPVAPPVQSAHPKPSIRPRKLQSRSPRYLYL